ncbi:dihydrodipicolinate synthase family protein [Pseudomonas putida]|uniref:dihydrodipicolinate synthase family protein n=1 Tax=Pseudomonas putida TaxID=303 RepID=UPI00300F09BB
MKSAVRGIIPAILTVWGSDEQYDRKKQEAYVTWLLDNGANAISIAGSTGEMLAMSTVEQAEIIDHVTRFIGGQVPVLASVGKYSTLETLELAHAAKASGVDELMVILPYYYKPYKEAAIRHVRTVHQEVGLPICLYNNPNFAGYELSPREVANLYEEGTIASVKAAHGDANRLADLRAMCDMTIYYGHDLSPLPGYAAGADGWLSGILSAFPKQCRALQDALRDEKDLDKGRAIWKKFAPFIEFYSDPAVNAHIHWLEIFKHAVRYQGVDVGVPRRPLVELPHSYQERLNPLIDILIS